MDTTGGKPSLPPHTAPHHKKLVKEGLTTNHYTPPQNIHIDELGMSVGYRRDPRPASTTPSQTSALRTSTLLASAERIRQQEEDTRLLNERIRLAARQGTTRQQQQAPGPSLLNILLFGLGIMLTERVEDGDTASVGQVLRILDDILVLLLDPVFEEVFGDGVGSDGGQRYGGRGGERNVGGEGTWGGALGGASEAA